MVGGLKWTCPRCQYQNQVDGTYEAAVVDGRIQAILHDMTPAELLALRESVAMALQAPGSSVNEMASAIEKHSGWLATLVRSKENRAEVYAILSVLLAVISILLSVHQSGSAPTPPQIHQTIYDVQVGQYHDLPIPRRGPCFCGSEKRYKNCHGKAPSQAEIQRSMKAVRGESR